MANITSSGRLNVNSDLQIGVLSGTTATLSISDSGSTVDNSGHGTFVGGSGTGIIDFGVDGPLITDFVDVRQGGSIVGSGNLQGDLFLDGTLAPGNSPGILDIDGDLIMNNQAFTAIEIGGLTPGTQFDVIDVRDDLTLDGILSVSFINGFVPVTGDSFEFLLFGGILSGQFDSVQISGLPAGVNLDVDVGPNGISIVVPAAAPIPAPPVLMGFALLLLLRKRSTARRPKGSLNNKYRFWASVNGSQNLHLIGE